MLDDEEDEKILRINVEEPRIKYDVEVVTKLIVYGGNCFSMELNIRDWVVECRFVAACISGVWVIYDWFIALLNVIQGLA